MLQKHETENGSITVIALIFLVVLTVLAIAVSDTSTTDVWISRNEGAQMNNFFVAEGGVRREGQEIGSSNYSVTDINTTATIANQDGLQPSGATLPNPDNASGHHLVIAERYNFQIVYAGFDLPPKGYSATEQSMFNFDINANSIDGGATVQTRYYKIGPRAK